jgi:hypothetical protein
VSRVELLTRFGTRLQSYIRPVCRASDEALALMDFRALRSADQSSGLSRPCVATEFGSAGPTGSPSASHKTPYATSARAVFSAPISLWAHAVLRPALSQPGRPSIKVGAEVSEISRRERRCRPRGAAPKAAAGSGTTK